MATNTLETLLKTRPDFGKETPEYITAMVQSLSWLSPEEHGWLTHPREGLHTVCKFLPTAADVHEFIRDKRARLEAVQPAPTTYRKFEPEAPGPWDRETDFERKKRVVREFLGYDPANPVAAPKRDLVAPTDDEARSVFKGLKTPPAPPSKYLVAFLERQGWPHLPRAFVSHGTNSEPEALP